MFAHAMAGSIGGSDLTAWSAGTTAGTPSAGRNKRERQRCLNLGRLAPVAASFPLEVRE